MTRCVAILPFALMLGGCGSYPALPTMAFNDRPLPIGGSDAPHLPAHLAEADLTVVDIEDFGYRTACDPSTPTGSRIARDPECHVVDRASQDDSLDRQLIRERIEHLRRQQLSVAQPATLEREAALQEAVLTHSE